MRSLNIRLQSLSIFRALLEDPVVEALGAYLESLEQDNVAQSVSRYAAFVSRLYSTEKRTLAGYIQSIVNNDENSYIRLIGRGQEPWPEMVETVEAGSAETFNSSDWCRDLVSGQYFSHPESYALDAGQGTWLVRKGTDGPVLLACEQTRWGGTVFLSGSAFLLDGRIWLLHGTGAPCRAVCAGQRCAGDDHEPNSLRLASRGHFDHRVGAR